VVEREASCGITKLRVDGGRAIDVSEAMMAAVAGVERAGAWSSCVELFFRT
jgi:TPP-dependent pyruvate/acetoin dehydrogenase alpha subunit